MSKRTDNIEHWVGFICFVIAIILVAVLIIFVADKQ